MSLSLQTVLFYGRYGLSALRSRLSTANIAGVTSNSSEGAVNQKPDVEAIRHLLLDLGFCRVGFAQAGPARNAERLADWVHRGFAGNMSYLERSLERRQDPRRVLEGARSVIVTAVHYDGPTDFPRHRGQAVIAAYALGKDYHHVLQSRLRHACRVLGERYGGNHRYYVDTGPVLERDWAERVGLGWIGKNTCAIDSERGSYFFIGAILTTLILRSDPPAENHCGTCRLCIDACPTDAIVAPYELDSRLCISYLTIEHRGEVPEALEPQIGNHVFGCDICQEVCPFNRERTESGTDVRERDPELAPRGDNLSPTLEDLAALDETGFRKRFPQSAVRRAKFEGFLRNVIIALGNSPDPGSSAMLDRLAERTDVMGNSVLAETLRRARARSEGGGESGKGRGTGT